MSFLNLTNGTNSSNLTMLDVLPSQLFADFSTDVEDHTGPKTCWDYEPAFEDTTGTNMFVKIKSLDSCIKPCWKNPVVRGFKACNSTPSYDFALLNRERMEFLAYRELVNKTYFSIDNSAPVVPNEITVSGAGMWW
jgi:hypothetical protein